MERPQGVRRRDGFQLLFCGNLSFSDRAKAYQSSLHNLFYCQRTGLNLFLQHIVPPEAPQRNKFLHYLKNMVLLQEKGEINSSASGDMWESNAQIVKPPYQLTDLLWIFVALDRSFVRKNAARSYLRQRLFSTIPLLLNWLSFLYYFTDLPYTLYYLSYGLYLFYCFCFLEARAWNFMAPTR